jgi:methylated-DNA-[protein]-cysteine S-methyltransferase
MLGRAYTFFETAIGRCAIAWGEAGIVGVQLPEAREIDTRRRLFHLYPEARETRPTQNAEAAIEGMSSCCAEARPTSPMSCSIWAAFPFLISASIG